MIQYIKFIVALKRKYMSSLRKECENIIINFEVL